MRFQNSYIGFLVAGDTKHALRQLAVKNLAGFHPAY